MVTVGWDCPDTPLWLIFPRLYEYCSSKQCLVCECFIEGEWKIPFRISFGVTEISQWEELLSLLEGIHLNNDSDLIHWAHEKAGQYTTRSMYRLKLHRGVVNIRMKKVWGSNLNPVVWLKRMHGTRMPLSRALVSLYINC